MDVFGQLERHLQQGLLAATEQCQRTMRWDRSERFLVGEVIAELRGGLLLAFSHDRGQHAVILQVAAQACQQFGIFRELLHQDLPRTLERCLDVRDAGVFALFGGNRRFEVLGGFDLRAQRVVGQQRRRQRVEAGLAGNLRLGAALHLVGEVQIFQPLLGLGLLDRRAQGWDQLALLLDAREDGRAPLLELPQINQPLLKVAELGIVQSPGRFLAVTRDERHGRTFVEQCDRRHDLMHGGGEFMRNARFDGGEHGDI